MTNKTSAERSEDRKLKALHRDLRSEYPEVVELETERDGIEEGLVNAARQGDSSRYTRLQMRRVALPYEIEEAYTEAARRMAARLEREIEPLQREIDEAESERREALNAEPETGSRRRESSIANRQKADAAASRRGKAQAELSRIQDRLAELRELRKEIGDG